MRGQRDICLFCRHAVKPRTPPGSTRRWLASPPVEPFVLPRVVIDLDAADSKFVRSFEDMPEDERLAQLRSKKLTYKRVPPTTQVQQPDSSAPEGVHARSKAALRTKVVTAPDLMQFALLGDPFGYSSGASWLYLIFKRRTIQREDDAATKIRQLTLGFTTDASKTLYAAGFRKSTWEYLKEDLVECRTFFKLARQLTMLSTTRLGSLFLAYKGWSVFHAIRKCRMHGFEEGTSGKVAEVMISDIVELLNNLTRNMMSKDVRIGNGLYNAGLYYASKASILPAVKMYLEIGLRYNYDTFFGVHLAIRNLQSEYARELPAPTRWAAWKEHRVRQEELLKLITGWNSTDVSVRKVIFASNDSTLHVDAYSRYILGIGEMGFSNALWEEWQSPPAIFAVENVEFKARLFAMAFLVARDRTRALQVLESVAKYNTNDSTRVVELFRKHYQFHRLSPSDEVVEMIETSVPASPQSTLEFFEKMLVLDYPKFVPDTKYILRWATRDERDGLLVMPQEGHDPIYWKAEEPGIRTEATE